MRGLLKTLKIITLVLGALLLSLALLVGYWFLRPNRAQVDPNVVLETWDITQDAQHNSNTDLIRWQGAFFLAHVASPYHFSSDDSVLYIKRSNDLGRTWEIAATFNPADDDIRDPKFGIIGERLFLYALKNNTFNPEPYQTVYAYSDDGQQWTDLNTIPGHDGWLFWRPKTRDGQIYYNTAYWFEHGKAILIRSSDGIHWETLSTIHTGSRMDETEIEFLPDGSLIATARLEYDESWLDGALGDKRGSTLISISQPPFMSWNEQIQSRVTRLDGPCLFSYHGRVYAAGRFQVDVGRGGLLTDQGSALAAKRTALFEIRRDGLAYLTDFPSAGDTSYCGVILDGDTGYFSYYTSPIDRDYAWIAGMFARTAVRMAKVDLKTMQALADRTSAR